MFIGITDVTKGQVLRTYPKEADHILVGFVSANGEELQRQPQTRPWLCWRLFSRILQEVSLRREWELLSCRFSGYCSFCSNPSSCFGHADAEGSNTATSLRLSSRARHPFSPRKLPKVISTGQVWFSDPNLHRTTRDHLAFLFLHLAGHDLQK